MDLARFAYELHLAGGPGVIYGRRGPSFVPAPRVHATWREPSRGGRPDRADGGSGATSRRTGARIHGAYRSATLERAHKRPGAAQGHPSPRPGALRAADGAGAHESGAIPARCPVVDRLVCYYDGCRHWQGGCAHPEATAKRRRRRRR